MSSLPGAQKIWKNRYQSFSVRSNFAWVFNFSRNIFAEDCSQSTGIAIKVSHKVKEIADQDSERGIQWSQRVEDGKKHLTILMMLNLEDNVGDTQGKFPPERRVSKYNTEKYELIGQDLLKYGTQL